VGSARRPRRGGEVTTQRTISRRTEMTERRSSSRPPSRRRRRPRTPRPLPQPPTSRRRRHRPPPRRRRRRRRSSRTSRPRRGTDTTTPRRRRKTLTRVVPYEATSGWSSKASDGVERRRCVSGLKAARGGGEKRARAKVLKERRSPRERARMGTSVMDENAPEYRDRLRNAISFAVSFSSFPPPLPHHPRARSLFDAVGGSIHALESSACAASPPSPSEDPSSLGKRRRLIDRRGSAFGGASVEVERRDWVELKGVRRRS